MDVSWFGTSVFTPVLGTFLVLEEIATWNILKKEKIIESLMDRTFILSLTPSAPLSYVLLFLFFLDQSHPQSDDAVLT